MDFFDANCWFGVPMRRHLAPIGTARDLLAAMDRAGIARALAWHATQRECSAVTGNELLASALRRHTKRLVGCFSLLPPHCGDMPPIDDLFRALARGPLRVLRAFPTEHRFLLDRVSLGPILDAATERRVPLFLSLAHGVSWRDIYDLLAQFPALTCVLCDHGCWGSDRYFRPLLEQYPRVHVDTAAFLLDGGIEAFVRDYGPERLLFSSGFPDAYHGGMMLALRHAHIPAAAKRLIAAGNLERLLAEACA